MTLQTITHPSPFDHSTLLNLAKRDLNDQSLNRKIRGNNNIFQTISTEVKELLISTLSNNIDGFSDYDWDFELFVSREPVGVHNDRNIHKHAYGKGSNERTVETRYDVGAIIPLEWNCKQPYTITFDKVYPEDKVIYSKGRFGSIDGNPINLDLKEELLIDKLDTETYWQSKPSWNKQLNGLQIHSLHKWSTDTIIIFETARLHSSSDFVLNQDSYKMSFNGLGYAKTVKVMKNNKTFCSMAWNHQFIDPTGRVKPCCRFAEQHRPKDHDLAINSLSNIFYSPWMYDIRSKMLSDEKISGCIRCYQEEASGKKSLRQRYNDNSELPIDKLVNLDNPTVRWLELAISNDCNLACRMCDSRYAWKWFADEKQLYGDTHNKVEHSKSDIANVFPFIDQLVHLKFTGGEPLITVDHWRLLDKLLQERDCSDIFLNYSTNCTINPKDEWIKKWSKFKKVEFALSFDGIADTWELIRYPSKWSDAEKIIQRFFEMTKEINVSIGLRSTISINNILNMPESYVWWIENWNKHAKDSYQDGNWINPTHLTYPECLSITVLPLKYKDIVAKKLKSRLHEFENNMRNSIETQIRLMYNVDDSHKLPELKRYTQSLDKMRQQDFFKANPEFKGLFDD
jgi:organic radical activating enzyme